MLNPVAWSANAREHQNRKVSHLCPVLFAEMLCWAYVTDVKTSGDVVANFVLPAKLSSVTSLAVNQWSCESHRPRDSSHQYRDETLRPNTGAVGPAFLLVQDNAQVNVVRVCKHYLDHEDTDATDWTPHSPHLNPAVNRWDVNVWKWTVEDPVAHWCPVPNVVGHLL